MTKKDQNQGQNQSQKQYPLDRVSESRVLINVDFATLASIADEDVLRAALKANGKPDGSSIIIAADHILPILVDALKWRQQLQLHRQQQEQRHRYRHCDLDS